MLLRRSRLFWAVGLGHITNDTFTSMGPVLLAYLSGGILPMTNTQIGLAVSLNQLVTAFGQPLFGWLADRTGGRWMGTIGLACTVTMMMLTLAGAQTGIYWLMLIPYMGLAVGSSMFHPVGTMHAAGSDPKMRATNLGLFFLFGQAGLALGPALVGLILDRANIYHNVFSHLVSPVLPSVALQQGSASGVFALALAAIPGVLWLGLNVPNARSYLVSRYKAASKGQTAARFAFPVKPFMILAVIIALRSLAQPGTVSFFPILFRDKGWDPGEYGLITSFFWLASGLSGVFFGRLADLTQPRYVIAASLCLGAPAFFLLPRADGALAYLLALTAGSFSGATGSITVVMAQEMIPGNKGLASGSVMGFSFGMGAIASLFIGGLSDTIGLNTTFQIVAGMTLLAGLMGLGLPMRPPHAVLEPAESAPSAAAESLQGGISGD